VERNLISGEFGFIGTYLVRQTLEHGEEVVVRHRIVARNCKGL
jgi:hypothetical protein